MNLLCYRAILYNESLVLYKKSMRCVLYRPWGGVSQYRTYRQHYSETLASQAQDQSAFFAKILDSGVSTPKGRGPKLSQLAESDVESLKFSLNRLRELHECVLCYIELSS